MQTSKEKIKLEQVAYAVYVIAMNLNGRCPYCGEDMSGIKFKYMGRHWNEVHATLK